MPRNFTRTHLIAVLALIALFSVAPQAWAQVAGEARVTSFFSWFSRLVQTAGYFIFLIALMAVGYKSAFQEGYKISDSKGVVIGGLIFGLAATIATFFVNG
jgi:hypothetical protein